LNCGTKEQREKIEKEKEKHDEDAKKEKEKKEEEERRERQRREDDERRERQKKEDEERAKNQKKQKEEEEKAAQKKIEKEKEASAQAAKNGPKTFLHNIHKKYLLEWTNSENDEVYKNKEYECDICMQKRKTYNGRFHAELWFDVCKDCAERKAMKERPPLLCDWKHILVFTEYAEGPYLDTGMYICKKCNKKRKCCDGRYFCSQCNFDLCDACARKQDWTSKLKIKDEKGHVLLYSTYHQEGYSSGNYICNMCKKTLLCADGRMLCAACKYDICKDCAPKHKK